MAAPPRRLRGKQSVAGSGLRVDDPVGHAAIADEAWSELVALSPDSKRKHIHWTHVRTHDANHVQPRDMSRQAFWAHLERVYKDVYPEPANKTGSILLFGGVAKELHADSRDEALREEHHHAPTYSSKQHMWKRIAQVSLDKYRVPMHAACHDGYTSMYEYVRKASPKKPLSEIDAEFFMSKDHPRGSALRRLLEAGQRSNTAYAGRTKRAGGSHITHGLDNGSQQAPKRVRVSDVYDIVRTGGFRHALALQAHAETVARHGDTALAQFCTSHGTARLQEHLNAAWAVLDAPRLCAPAPTRIEKLRQCALQGECVCHGVWKAGAAFVLANNGEDPRLFGRDVCRALALGAKRGVHIGLVGEPGCGKSMLLQPLEIIYQSMAPPEDGSTFPLAGALDAEILLWQDFEYNSKTVNFTDLLRLLVGERVGVRIPREPNRALNNTSPLFYSALEKIVPHMRGVAAGTFARKALAMDERFTMRFWTKPLPLHRRVADFPHCAPCFASFMLENDAAWHAEAGGAVWL